MEKWDLRELSSLSQYLWHLGNDTARTIHYWREALTEQARLKQRDRDVMKEGVSIKMARRSFLLQNGFRLVNFSVG